MQRPEFSLKVVLEGHVSPSEDRDKVREAMSQVLGPSRNDIEVSAAGLRMITDDLASITRLRDQLRDRHVRAAARKLLYAGRDGNRTTLMLNRQAAHAGVIALCGSEEESPLGPLHLTIESDDLDSVIQWLTAYEEG